MTDPNVHLATHPEPSLPGVLARWHQALLPDYNRPAALYWWTLLVVGSAAMAWAFVAFCQRPAIEWLALLALTTLSVLAALYPLRVPRTSNFFSVGEIFIFMALLFLGVPAAVLAAMVEGFVNSLRSSKRWSTRLGSPAIIGTSFALVGSLVEPWLRPQVQSMVASNTGVTVFGMTAFGLGYAAVTTYLLTRTGRLKRGERFSLPSFAQNFAWVIGASGVSATIAAVLLVINHLYGLSLMLSVIPLVMLLMLTLHFFARQQDALAQSLEDKAALTSLQAKQREDALTAQHVEELAASERRFNRAFTHASIGMILLDQANQVQLTNPALQHLLGATPDALQGRSIRDFVFEDDQARFDEALLAFRQGRDDHTVELRCRRLDGPSRMVSIAGGTFADDGGTESLILQWQDVTARHLAEAQLAFRAFHDKLTGLPNRSSIAQAIDAGLARARADASQRFAVLSIDIDRFKLINDSRGYAAGNEFLVKVAERLNGALRHRDMLARLGGDEFAVLADDVRDAAEASELATRLIEVLGEPIALRDLTISTSASIGITLSTLGYQQAEDMLRDADIAMFASKQRGKAQSALFDVELHRQIEDRVQLEAELRTALDQGDLWVAFQPLFDMQRGELIGFEALSRWTHANKGEVPPSAFIPIAEDAGLITRITRRVLDESCRQLRTWQQSFPDGERLHVNVNVSGADLLDPDFVSQVQRTLQSHQLEPRHLHIELTENILMSQLQTAMQTLQALKDLGVGLAVDDFGTGHSSLSHLSRLPIDTLKIDMSFVRPLTDDQCKEAAVIRSIVLLGAALGKTIVAEGVESATHVNILRRLGCPIGQGYFFSRPLAADSVSGLIRAQGMAWPHALVSESSRF